MSQINLRTSPHAIRIIGHTAFVDVHYSPVTVVQVRQVGTDIVTNVLLAWYAGLRIRYVALLLQMIMNKLQSPSANMHTYIHTTYIPVTYCTYITYSIHHHNSNITCTNIMRPHLA